MRAYKIRFYPTLAQRRQLSREFIACRFTWNWALHTRTQAYKSEKKNLNAISLSRELTKLRTEKPFLKNASATTLQNVLWSLDEAYKKFFRHEAIFPKFKRRDAVKSCCYQLDKRQANSTFRPGELLKLPKLGAVRVVWSYPDIPIMPNSATVSKTPSGKWYVSLQCDYTEPGSPPITNKTIGLDLGLKAFVTTSDGIKIRPPKFLKASARRLKIIQRRHAKTRKGGANRRKLKYRVARIHQRIASQRANFLHNLSTLIVSENQVIAIEDLNVLGMMANGKLARSIGDSGWYEFRRQLTYKSGWQGRILNVVPRFTRSTGVCPNCGCKVDKLALSVRKWQCPECLQEHDRDIAAARILDLIGNQKREPNTVRSTGINACGLANKPDDSNASCHNKGWDDAGKVQRTRQQGCCQRVSRKDARS